MSETKNKIAIIRVRGRVKIPAEIEDTFTMLKLRKKNACSIYEETDSLKGMLQKIKDYATWGNIDQDTIKELTKRNEGNIFHLNSPKKGFGRKGTKTPFAKGGALGDRKEKIKDLIGRML